MVADSQNELTHKYKMISNSIRIVSVNGDDMMRHDLLDNFNTDDKLEIVDGGENSAS